MDGKGAWRGRVFVERLWRTVKYEQVYLRAYDRVTYARADIAEYIGWHNVKPGHTRLAGMAPDAAYRKPLPKLKVAA